MIRREPFGGIIFDHRNRKIYKLNKISFRAVELFSQDNLDISEIAEDLKKEFKINVDFVELRKFIEKILTSYGHALKQQRGDKTNTIWCNDWMGDSFSAPVMVYWSFTNLCNLNCMHCAWTSGSSLSHELETEECLVIIDELSRLGVGFISFSGGEPLTKKEQLYSMAKYCKKLGIEVGLGTNATLIDEYVAKEIKDIGFSLVQVSMEGLEAHDVIRGKGVYEKTIAGTKNLLSNNIPVTFSVAVCKINIGEVDNIIRLSKKLGVKNIRIVRFIPIGRGAKNRDFFELNKEDEIKLAIDIGKKTLEKTAYINITTNKHYINLALLYNSELNNAGSKFSDFDCPAGRTNACITPDGSVAPCPLLGSLGLSEGNLKTKSFHEIWKFSSLFNKVRKEKRYYNSNEECKYCKYWYICKGGCKASSLVYYGDLMMPDHLCFKSAILR